MRTPRLVAATLMVFSAGTFVGVTANPVYAACSVPQAISQISDTPWHQAQWGLSKLPADATGRDIRVAVLDSGVDDRHPQLANKVLSTDPLHQQPGSQDRCGHGTGVAGVIAARRLNGVPFHGIAPDAFILSARVSEKVGGNDDAEPIDPEEMAAAVNWAVANNANVINFSFAYTSQARLAPFKAAVDNAIANNVVIVAAVGNNFGEGNPTPYPAAWPGVIGVAAVGRDGQRLDSSGMGSYVDIAAPGSDIVVPRPGAGYGVEAGTSFAAPMVSATAALIFDRFPGIKGPEVVKRLLATADPAPGGRRSDGYGAGVLNPLRAVTEMVDGVQPVKIDALAAPTLDPAAAGAAERAAVIRERAMWIAALGVIAALVAVALMVALPAGVRRRWRPAGRTASRHEMR